MTRRDYLELAAALKEARETYPDNSTSHDLARAGTATAARAVARVCARDPKFDRDRFLRDCGVKS